MRTHNKPSVMIDLDEVMVNSNQTLIHEFNRMTDKNLTLDEWKTFDIGSLYQITPSEYYMAYDRAKVALVSEPREGSIEAVRKLIEYGITPVFVTARRPTGLDPSYTNQWLEKYNLPTDNLHIIGNKSKGRHVAELSNRHAFLAAIDDSIVNIDELHKHCPNLPLYLMDCPHNVAASGHHFTRVKCISQTITDILERI